MANIKQTLPMTPATSQIDQIWPPLIEDNFQSSLHLPLLDTPEITQIDPFEEDKVKQTGPLFLPSNCELFPISFPFSTVRTPDLSNLPLPYSLTKDKIPNHQLLNQPILTQGFS